MDIHSPVIPEEVHPPGQVQKLGSGKGYIPVDQQHTQKLKLPVGKLHVLPCSGDPVSLHIHSHVVNGKYLLLPVKSSEHHLNPGNQFLHSKGLHNIILCPAVQASYPVSHFIPGCHVDDRYRTDLCHHLKSVHIRKVNVQKDDVGPFLLCRSQGLPAGICLTASVTCHGEGSLHQFIYGRLIFHYQNICHLYLPFCQFFGWSEV